MAYEKLTTTIRAAGGRQGATAKIQIGVRFQFQNVYLVNCCFSGPEIGLGCLCI
jgi:hypothetical protein